MARVKRSEECRRWCPILVRPRAKTQVKPNAYRRVRFIKGCRFARERPDTEVTDPTGHIGGMRWKECSVMDERLHFVAHRLAGEPMAELCREFGISRKTAYKILGGPHSAHAARITSLLPCASEADMGPARQAESADTSSAMSGGPSGSCSPVAAPTCTDLHS